MNEATIYPWSFNLLGGLSGERNGRCIELPPYRCQRLLVYLLLKQDKPIRRERLIGDLYPGLSTQSGGKHLSDHLWLLRSSLPDLPFMSLGSNLQIDPSQVWVDCVAFSSGVVKSNSEAMLAAVQLYQGDLAPDLYDDWVVLMREHYRSQYKNALLSLAVQFDKIGRRWQSSQLLERYLLEEPYDEAAVRLLMQVYISLGRRGLAISAFEKYRLLCIEKLSVMPEPETQVMYESILARTNLPRSASTSNSMEAESAFLVLQKAKTALNEGNRFEMVNLLRAAARITDPLLAIQRDLLAIDEAICWNDLSRARKLLESFHHSSAAVGLRWAAFHLAEDETEIAYPFLQQALKISADANDRELEISALIEISEIQLRRAEFQDAFLTIARAIHLLSHLDFPLLLARAYLQKGKILYRQGANQDAREILFRVQSLAEGHHFNCLLAEINSMIGASFVHSGLYLSANKVFAQALETARDVGLVRLEAQILLGMAAAHDFLGHREGSIQMLTSARLIYLAIDNEVGLATVDYNLAAALPYHDEDRCDEAIRYAHSALEIFKKTQRTECQAVAYTSLAFALWVKGHPAEAIPYYQQSIELHQANGEAHYIPELLAYIGLAHLDLRNTQAALQWTSKALYEQSIRNHSDIAADIFYACGAVQEALGYPQEARKFFQRAYQTLLDFAQDIEDEKARYAYFHRDPVTRRLMKKVNELGHAPPARQIVIKRNASGRTREQVEFALMVDAGASDQALAQGRGNSALRLVRLERLLSNADRQRMRLTLKEMANALNVSARTIQRDLSVINSRKNS